MTYEGEQHGQGRENVKSFLAENLDLVFEISEKVRQAVGIGEPVEGADDDNNDENTKVVDLVDADKPVEG